MPIRKVSLGSRGGSALGDPLRICSEMSSFGFWQGLSRESRLLCCLRHNPAVPSCSLSLDPETKTSFRADKEMKKKVFSFCGAGFSIHHKIKGTAAFLPCNKKPLQWFLCYL